MKIAIIPDIHIGSSLNYGKLVNGENSKVTDKKDLLNHIYDTLKINNIDRIILTGDIWESTNLKPNYISILFDFLDKCSKLCPIDIVQGNHDFVRSGSNVISNLDFLQYIPNVFIHQSINNVVYGDVSITYLPFFDRRQLNKNDTADALDYIKEELNKCLVSNKTNICIGHMAIQSSLYIGDEISDITNEIFIPLDVLSGFDYSLFGHVHKFQIFSTTPYIAHVGSLDRSCFGEDGKYICIVDTLEEAVETVELPSKELVEIEVVIPSEEDPTEYISNVIKQKQLSNCIVRIKIETDTNSMSLDKDKINKQLVKLGVEHVVNIIEKKRIEKLDTNTDIDETIDPYKAVDMFLNTTKIEDQLKQNISSVCKDIIKKVKQGN